MPKFTSLNHHTPSPDAALPRKTMEAMRDYHRQQTDYLETIETRLLKELYSTRQKLRYHTEQILQLQNDMDTTQ